MDRLKLRDSKSGHRDSVNPAVPPPVGAPVCPLAPVQGGADPTPRFSESRLRICPVCPPTRLAAHSQRASQAAKTVRCSIFRDSVAALPGLSSGRARRTCSEPRWFFGGLPRRNAPALCDASVPPEVNKERAQQLLEIEARPRRAPGLRLWLRRPWGVRIWHSGDRGFFELAAPDGGTGCLHSVQT